MCELGDLAAWASALAAFLTLVLMWKLGRSQEKLGEFQKALAASQDVFSRKVFESQDEFSRRLLLHELANQVHGAKSEAVAFRAEQRAGMTSPDKTERDHYNKLYLDLAHAYLTVLNGAAHAYTMAAVDGEQFELLFGTEVCRAVRLVDASYLDAWSNELRFLVQVRASLVAKNPSLDAEGPRA